MTNRFSYNHAPVGSTPRIVCSYWEHFNRSFRRIVERTMGWRFRLDRLLEDLNYERVQIGRAPLTWSHVAPLLGMSRQSLQNLASNRELKVTNTRFLEAICRFFGCPISELIEPVPSIEAGADQDEVDRLVALVRELEPNERPAYHVETLYEPDAARRWQLHRDQ